MKKVEGNKSMERVGRGKERRGRERREKEKEKGSRRDGFKGLVGKVRPRRVDLGKVSPTFKGRTPSGHRPKKIFCGRTSSDPNFQNQVSHRFLMTCSRLVDAPKPTKVEPETNPNSF